MFQKLIRSFASEINKAIFQKDVFLDPKL